MIEGCYDRLQEKQGSISMLQLRILARTESETLDAMAKLDRLDDKLIEGEQVLVLGGHLGRLQSEEVLRSKFQSVGGGLQQRDGLEGLLEVR